ncbi:MAG: glycosyltransferase family 2 protein [Methanomicrobiales archaeon]|nr:glycosyltransferase family 2 protein [Methanomicrobiales archaeon]
MYAQHRIGVILPVQMGDPITRRRIRTLPDWVDHLYVIGASTEDEKTAHLSPAFHPLPPAPDELLGDDPDELLGDDPFSTKFFPKGEHPDDPLAPVREALQDALSREMDVILLLPEKDGREASILSHVIDPIIWGRAEFIRGEWAPAEEQAGTSCFTVTAIPAGQLSSPADDLLKPSGSYTAFSRRIALRFVNLLSHGGRRILAAIPAYNEELTIGSMILKARKHADEVLVVDDGSTDATAEIAREAGARVISHERNMGKGAAVLTALKHARENSTDLLVLLDGDAQHNPDEIPHLVAPILEGDADLVIGSRFLNDNNNGIPAYRRLGQKTLDLATRATGAHGITDTQSGFRALSRRAIEALEIASDDYNIESDVLAHLAEERLAIKEVPIHVRYDIPNGHKKHPLAHGLDILTHIIGFVSYRRPLLAFGIPGIFITILGIALGIYTFSAYYTMGAFHYVLFIGSIVALILGLMLVTSAFIMNSLAFVVRSQMKKH